MSLIRSLRDQNVPVDKELRKTIIDYYSGGLANDGDGDGQS